MGEGEVEIEPLFSYKILNSKSIILKKEFYMYKILNLDEIKNELQSLLVNCETNLMSLIKL